MFAWFAAVVLKLHVSGVAVLLVAFQTQLIGVPVDVSLNTIVNGATPAQPCEVVFVATDVFVELKLATGALNLNSRRAPI